jgi:D-tagatose-1,6-bisphosphate aldolase subunit GatZ/KbaZ
MPVTALRTTSGLADLVRRHGAGEPVGVYSVCSAHPIVLDAAIAQAADDGTIALVEATSNQVDQFGGYTGMRPADFRDLVLDIADRRGLPRERVVLGGDHLGPNRWQKLPADEAMANADVLVAAYVEAGYTKIHLDCSMSCADDPAVLGDAVVAERTARLMTIAEDAAAGREVCYVIGTEVPVPGGAHETLDGVPPTSPAAARATITAHQKAFAAAGLGDVWSRVIALVVQPGVEFDHLKVVDYVRAGTTELRRVLDDQPTLVFEAHSTDYQRPEGLRELVEDHWAILKVGPGLTFALREALFALAAIEAELVPAAKRSKLPEVVEQRMLADPGYWQGYYDGDADAQRIARRYSYSDRLRYYWPDPDIETARITLFDNLDRVGIPLPLLSQYLPEQYARVRAGEVDDTAEALVVDHVRDVMRVYSRACNPTIPADPHGAHHG